MSTCGDRAAKKRASAPPAAWRGAKRARGWRRAQVDRLLETNSELSSLLVEAVFERVAAVAHASSQVRSRGEFGGSVGTLCAVRLLSREFRERADAHIVKFMDDLVGGLQELRKLALVELKARTSFPSTFDVEGRVWRGPPEAEQAVQLARGARTKAAEALLSKASRGLGVAVAGRLVDDASSRRCEFSMAVPATVGFFVAAAAHRCQLHGPAGVSCRNCCKVGGKDMSNFFLVGCGGGEVAIYARERCVRQSGLVCFPRSLGGELPEGPETVALGTVRAMLRSVGVGHPFPSSLVYRETDWWGVGEEAGRCRAPLPRAVFICNHPAVPRPKGSLQNLLGLSHAEAADCRGDAERKVEQQRRHQRDVEELAAVDLEEDMNAWMASSDTFPADTLAELHGYCAGMATSLRLAARLSSIDSSHSCVVHSSVRAGKAVRHALDCPTIRQGLRTAKFFLDEVARADAEDERLAPMRARLGPRASAEAVDFVSGMHVGLYGMLSAPWCTGYGALNGISGVSAVDAATAMRFFDQIDETSLSVVSVTAQGFPDRWGLSAADTLISFNANLRSHDSLSQLRCAAERLVRANVGEAAAQSLPPLFAKRAMDGLAGYPCRGSRTSEHANAVTDWFKTTYAALARSACTRCAALDLLGALPYVLINHARTLRELETTPKEGLAAALCSASDQQSEGRSECGSEGVETSLSDTDASEGSDA